MLFIAGTREANCASDKRNEENRRSKNGVMGALVSWSLLPKEARSRLAGLSGTGGAVAGWTTPV